jgi:PAS domain S-box-containing protein
MDASLDIICSIDEQKITYISAACKAISGYDPHELIGKNYSDLIQPKIKKLYLILIKMSEKGNPVKIFETRIIHKKSICYFYIV